jgi:hypothetical protein
MGIPLGQIKLFLADNILSTQSSTSLGKISVVL